MKVGDNVSTGQQIGWAGNTGISGASAMLGADGKPQSSGQTNIHLHFMIARKDGGNWYFVDPYGAYSQSTSCYTGTGSGAYAHYFGPVYPSYHDADASLFQEAFNYTFPTALTRDGIPLRLASPPRFSESSPPSGFATPVTGMRVRAECGASRVVVLAMELLGWMVE